MKTKTLEMNRTRTSWHLDWGQRFFVHISLFALSPFSLSRSQNKSQFNNKSEIDTCLCRRLKLNIKFPASTTNFKAEFQTKVAKIRDIDIFRSIRSSELRAITWTVQWENNIYTKVNSFNTGSKLVYNILATFYRDKIYYILYIVFSIY